MKTLVIALLIAAPVGSPATATGFGADTKAGAFAGARFRMALGGKAKPRVALTVAPMVRAPGDDTRVRFGEGVAFGLTGPVRLSLGGRPMSFAAQRTSIDMKNASGISTLGWVGIGAVALLAIGAIGYANSEGPCDSDCQRRLRENPPQR